jgi:hypothetical protein
MPATTLFLNPSTTKQTNNPHGQECEAKERLYIDNAFARFYPKEPEPLIYKQLNLLPSKRIPYPAKHEK